MFIPNPTARMGEKIAEKFLIEKGYKIIEKNFRTEYGEIDIISTHNNILVFVEVKTRTTNLFGGAIEAITYSKLKKLIKTSQLYKLMHDKLPEALRIDAILIDMQKGKVKKIEHIENISI